MFGLSIFIATFFPFLRIPLCTWATEALAIGTLSNKAKLSLRKNSFSLHIIFLATELGTGFKLSCNIFRKSQVFLPNKSGLVDKA